MSVRALSCHNPQSTFGVLGDWRNPHRVHPQGVPIPVFQGVEHAFKSPPKWLAMGRMEGSSTGSSFWRFPLEKRVHHQEIRGGTMPIRTESIA